MTAVANSVFTAAQFNQFVRDNLNETAAAKATMVSSIFVGNGLNSIVERLPQVSNVGNSETSASTSYTDLATLGPEVTTTTGTRALVFLHTAMENTAAAGTFMSFEVSGASSIAAADSAAINISGLAAERWRLGAGVMVTTLTAGSNTFTAKYKVTSGTGTWLTRQLSVIPF